MKPSYSTLLHRAQHTGRHHGTGGLHAGRDDPYGGKSKLPGSGIPEHIPSWGNIVSGGQGFVQVVFWVSFFPGMFLTLTVLSVVLIG